jgi:hypothetical protein
MSSPSNIEETSADRQVLKALENPEYVWRTIAGLERETKLPRKEIVSVLRHLPEDSLVTSKTRDGKRVYSTRRHYRKTQSFLGRLVSVLSNSVK